MKKAILFISTVFFTLLLSGQSNENYIKTTVYKVETTNGTTKVDGTGNLANNDKEESITYFDGLGRQKQHIGIRAGGNNQDIVSHTAYDAYGRQDKEYLPYAMTSTGGTYQTGALNAALNFYNAPKYENTLNPYSEKNLEHSPLSRVLEQGAPGADWILDKTLDTDHTIKFEYSANTTNEVRLFTVNLSYFNFTYTPSLTGNGTVYYDQGELYKTVTKDENWSPTQTYLKLHTTEEFKDKQGRVVLKRTYAHFDSNGDGDTNDAGDKQIPHDTYYVYDDYGNLSYVIPPKADTSDGISSTELSELCYQYIYDDKNRLVEKKIPGKRWEYIIYDVLDRPYLTTDTKYRLETNRWLITRYDDFGRVAYTGSGLETTPGWVSRFMLQVTTASAVGSVDRTTTASATLSNQQVYYDVNTHITELFTINYYDNYNDFDLAGGTSEDAYGVTPITNVKGLATCSKVKVLEASDKWITTVTYYDNKSRPIYIYTYNAYLETTDKVKYKLDFLGNVLESTTTHTKTGHATITTVDKYTYDHANRLLTHKQNINGQGDALITHNHYDALGQLEQKDVGNTQANPLQEIDYSYNIRGWLKEINNPTSLGNDLFSFKINYNTEDHSATKLYNGNISETEWKTANDNVLHWYTYSYDPLNRITSGLTGSANSSWNNKHNLKLVAYDKNGNITKLRRNGYLSNNSFAEYLDHLTYTYDAGNKLIDVLEEGHHHEGFKDYLNNHTGDDYTYDANGNMLKDYNKGIFANITYNHLNLPKTIPKGNGAISYIYDANGVKLEKKVVQYMQPTKYTYYAGNYVYTGDNNGSSLKFFNHAEGYVEPDGSGGYDYIYQYKDHLGNVRLSYMDSNNNGSVDSSEILEENNYYPFGLKHNGYNNVVNSTNPALKYKFGGKEMNNELGLGWYDFHARNYDASLGRWMNIDNAANEYYEFSPYSYVANCPIVASDPTGERIIITGSDEYISQVYYQLIMSARSEEGFNQLVEAIESKNTIVIQMGNAKKDGPQTYGWEKEDDGTYTRFMDFDPTQTVKADGVELSPDDLLVHELDHFNKGILGKVNTGKSYEGYPEQIDGSEASAVAAGNRHADAFNEPHRKTYTGRLGTAVDVYNKIFVPHPEGYAGKLVDSNKKNKKGKFIGEGSILIYLSTKTKLERKSASARREKRDGKSKSNMNSNTINGGTPLNKLEFLYLSKK